MRTVLYITYDGLTDPLGQSQILSYLKKLSNRDNRIIIVSFEKEAAYRKEADQIRRVVDENALIWLPLKYTKTPPVLSTIWDLMKGYRACKKVYEQYKPRIVHCRGYIASILGRSLKRNYGLKFIFDMRGWWPDEKLESGNWKHPIYKPVYRYLKGLEKHFFEECDFAVSLTHQGKEEIKKQGLAGDGKIGVIPTCVDFEIFKPRNDLARNSMRQKLGVRMDEKVFVYSGSLGGNYQVDMLVSAFKNFRIICPKSFLLILSKDDFDDQLKYKLVLEGLDRVAVHRSPFSEVTNYLQAGDVGFVYYKPTFSTIGRSPTKLGEYWASGIPVIAFSGIGDLDYIFERYPKGGVLLSKENTKWEMEMRRVQFNNFDLLRGYAQEYFDVTKGVDFYRSVYENLWNDKNNM